MAGLRIWSLCRIWIAYFTIWRSSPITLPDFEFREVNNVMRPDSPCMEDCIDQVGSATFVSKFDLLKGNWQVLLSDRLLRSLRSQGCIFIL